MDFKFPDVGEGIHEGVIVKWHVKVGDEVKQDDVLCEVETDKAIVEIPSPNDGVIDKLYHEEGETVNVGETLVSYHKEGSAAENATEDKPEEQKPDEQKLKETEDVKEDQGGVVGAIIDADKQKKKYSGPLFDVLKKESAGSASEGILPSVHMLKSDGGGAVKNEVKEDAPKRPASEKKDSDEYGAIEYQEMSQMRKAIVSHLNKTKSEMVPVTQVHYIDVSLLAVYRKSVNEDLKSEGVKLSFLPFIIEALKAAIAKNPRFNAAWSSDFQELQIKKYINVGIAVDTEEGLMVPVIKNVENCDIKQVANAIKDVALRARERKLKPDELKGQSITITNYGSVGSVIGTPIINFPDTCILGVGAIQKSPVLVDGELKEKQLLPLALTYDHRFNDGADAARFLNDVTTYLETEGSFKIT